MTLTIIPIASLPEATIVNDDDYLVMSQDGVTKKIKYSTVFDDIGAKGNKITTYTFTAADYWTYEPAQYEMVLFVNVRFGTATTIKVGSDGNLEAYISETTNTSTNPNIYCDSSNATDRNINISLNGSGIVTVISILNV